MRPSAPRRSSLPTGSSARWRRARTGRSPSPTPPTCPSSRVARRCGSACVRPEPPRSPPASWSPRTPARTRQWPSSPARRALPSSCTTWPATGAPRSRAASPSGGSSAPGLRKPAGAGGDVDVVGTVRRKRAEPEPARVGELAAAGRQCGRGELRLDVEGAVAAEALAARSAPVAAAGGEAADHPPAGAGRAELLLHLAARRGDGVLAAANAAARKHPPAVSVAVADEHDFVAAAEDAANAARARAPQNPPGAQQPQRHPVRRRPHPRDERHADNVRTAHGRERSPAWRYHCSATRRLRRRSPGGAASVRNRTWNTSQYTGTRMVMIGSAIAWAGYDSNLRRTDYESRICRDFGSRTRFTHRLGSSYRTLDRPSWEHVGNTTRDRWSLSPRHTPTRPDAL